MARARVFISGMVQGVFFRHETYEHARTRGLAGWVKNLPDGRVEATFEGPAAAVDSMIEWCHEGPRYAQVDSVDVEWLEPEGLVGFMVR